MKLWLTGSRTAIQLGAIVGRGGEGAVHEIAGMPGRVAKIYTKPPDALKLAKLTAMASVGDAQLLKVAAWPVDLLVDERGTMKGFVMPRIASRADIHELYSPKSRASEFPEADLRFLLHVAMNIARAVATVHQHGHVIGDINHGSILVGREGTVVLIDCDSFQVTAGGRTFTCDVGVPLFTPPELHDKPFRGLSRTANHDAFGLAVMLFHLLFMGRHPFAGRFLGRGDMSIEQAIREFRFAYGANRRASQMESPPATLPLAAMGAGIAGFFEQAFGRAGVHHRPTAVQWVSALESLAKTLKHCSQVDSHYYPDAAGPCPWCTIEQSTGSRLFGQRIVSTGPTGTVSVGQLWAAIEAVKGPGPAPDVWSAMPSTENAEPFLNKVRQIASLFIAFAGVAGCTAYPDGALVGIGGLIAAYFVWPRVSDEARQAFQTASRNWEMVHSEWTRQAGDTAFQAELAKLDSARKELTNLSNERARRLQRLKEARESSQKQAYLDRFRIDRGKIALIGDARVAMLASYGVETAADIDRNKIRSIPGFGETITKNLLAWRKEHEKNFRFNPNQGVDPKDIAAVERDIVAIQARLSTSLRAGPAQLQRLRAEALAARERLKAKVQQAWSEKEQARGRVNP